MGFGFAFFAAEVQSATPDDEPLTPPPPFAWFSASDSGQPGGAGDTILFEGFDASAVCVVPFVGHPITHGNINVQSTEPAVTEEGGRRGRCRWGFTVTPRGTTPILINNCRIGPKAPLGTADGRARVGVRRGGP